MLNHREVNPWALTFTFTVIEVVMKIPLGDEFDPTMTERKRWIRENFNADQYRIRDIGFLYPDFVVEFTEEKYATLFKIRWS